MKISKKLEQAHKSAASQPTYSFEFFVPKTSQGVQNLYDRIDRMYSLNPQFIDITWNAGGRLSNLTCELVSTSQEALGMETCMHLTCTGMPVSLVEGALESAFNSGCQNILALRGDPPHMSETWKATDGGFCYAKDLVRYIRNKYGDHFDIGVAGYPEGHPENSNIDELIGFLKEKVDAGASFVITQMFYDVDNFIRWVHKCRAAGITCPIIPGIMPISTYASFMRRANWCEIHLPQQFLDELEPIKGDDMKVREVGTKLVADMCRRMVTEAGIKHLHFYTMNLEKATLMVLEELDLIEEDSKSGVMTPKLDESASGRALPWRQSLGLTRSKESVRPIFWKNRKQSYVGRTQDWDEFPNGRWGDSRSPAYGDLVTYGSLMRQSAEKAKELWGSPESVADIGKLFCQYIEGKVKALPWSDAPITNEIDVIKPGLLKLNESGLLTINSQPAVNGASSNDPVYGWGPANGYVYQKSYLELLVSEDTLKKIVASIENIDKTGQITYYYVNNTGDLHTNSTVDGPNAVTWGIYPGTEIIQPTVVEKISFLAWKDEAFRLADEWANCFAEGSKTRSLLKEIANEWYLINIVHNDFHTTTAIFDIFNQL